MEWSISFPFQDTVQLTCRVEMYSQGFRFEDCKIKNSITREYIIDELVYSIDVMVAAKLIKDVGLDQCREYFARIIGVNFTKILGAIPVSQR